MNGNTTDRQGPASRNHRLRWWGALVSVFHVPFFWGAGKWFAAWPKYNYIFSLKTIFLVFLKIGA